MYEKVLRRIESKIILYLAIRSIRTRASGELGVIAVDEVVEKMKNAMPTAGYANAKFENF